MLPSSGSILPHVRSRAPRRSAACGALVLVAALAGAARGAESDAASDVSPDVSPDVWPDVWPDPGSAPRADLERGAALYENQCAACHDANVHLREPARVDSRETLRAWVAAWASHAAPGWGVEEIEAVTRYLSVELYGFTR